MNAIDEQLLITLTQFQGVSKGPAILSTVAEVPYLTGKARLAAMHRAGLIYEHKGKYRHKGAFAECIEDAKRPDLEEVPVHTLTVGDKCKLIGNGQTYTVYHVDEKWVGVKWVSKKGVEVEDKFDKDKRVLVLLPISDYYVSPTLWDQS